MIASALDLAMHRAATITVKPPALFGYGAPVGDDTLDDWQAQLDARHDHTPRGSRLLVRWEPGDPWEPVGRFFLWQALDPVHVMIEPWVRRALNGPSPRSTGHWCAAGYCLCDAKAQRWVGGATRYIDAHQWRIHRETGLYATRWWVIQGANGGHRYRWESTEVAALVSQMKGHGGQPPAAGDLPYAPFDARVLHAIRAEKRLKATADALSDLSKRKESLGVEERAEAERVAKALWDWQDEQAEMLWNDGAELLPRYFEDQIGRAPVGHKITTDYEAIEARHYHSHIED